MHSKPNIVAKNRNETIPNCLIDSLLGIELSLLIRHVTHTQILYIIFKFSAVFSIQYKCSLRLSCELARGVVSYMTDLCIDEVIASALKANSCVTQLKNYFTLN